MYTFPTPRLWKSYFLQENASLYQGLNRPRQANCNLSTILLKTETLNLFSTKFLFFINTASDVPMLDRNKFRNLRFVYGVNCNLWIFRFCKRQRHKILFFDDSSEEIYTSKFLLILPLQEDVVEWALFIFNWLGFIKVN